MLHQHAVVAIATMGMPIFYVGIRYSSDVHVDEAKPCHIFVDDARRQRSESDIREHHHNPCNFWHMNHMNSGLPGDRRQMEFFCFT